MRKLAKRGDTFDAIYADPDYNVGVRYNGESKIRPDGEYLTWCEDWSRLAYDLLKPTGNFFVVNYPRNNAYLWVRCLDSLFYAVHEYAWVYPTNVGHSKKRLTTAHRTILHCRKTNENKWSKARIAQPYLNPTDKRIRKNMANGSPGRMPYSWLQYNLVKNVSREKTDHACQIPEKLSELLFGACTDPGDSILVMFGGSGSEVVTAERLGLEYLAFEISPRYHALIEKRVASVRRELTKRKTAQKRVRTLSSYSERTLQTQ